MGWIFLIGIVVIAVVVFIRINNARSLETPEEAEARRQRWEQEMAERKAQEKAEIEKFMNHPIIQEFCQARISEFHDQILYQLSKVTDSCTIRVDVYSEKIEFHAPWMFSWERRELVFKEKKMNDICSRQALKRLAVAVETVFQKAVDNIQKEVNTDQAAFHYSFEKCDLRSCDSDKLENYESIHFCIKIKFEYQLSEW